MSNGRSSPRHIAHHANVALKHLRLKKKKKTDCIYFIERAS